MGIKLYGLVYHGIVCFLVILSSGLCTITAMQAMPPSEHEQYLKLNCIPASVYHLMSLPHSIFYHT